MIKLIIPLQSGEAEYKYADIRKPTSGLLADTREIAEDGSHFMCMKHFIAGCITSLYTSNKSDSEPMDMEKNIRLLVVDLPYKTADQLTIDIINSINPDNDGVEGMYECPRCDHKIICEDNKEKGIDNRDFIRNLERSYRPSKEANHINFTLTEPVEIVENNSSKKLLDTFKSFKMRYATLGDCIRAEELVGKKNTSKLQLAIYREAMFEVNGQPIDAKWKGQYADMLFRTIKDPRDMKRLAEEMDKYGLQRKSKKRCPKCEKVWEPDIDTTSFFYTALDENSR